MTQNPNSPDLGVKLLKYFCWDLSDMPVGHQHTKPQALTTPPLAKWGKAVEGEEIPFTPLLQTAKGAISGLAKTQHCRQRELITQPFHSTECLCVCRSV